MATITAYDTAGGKRYRVNYRKPDNSQSTKRGFRRKKDAELWAANAELSKARGDYIDGSAARVTVGELGATWLSAQTHLKPSSYRPIEIAWRLYVEPQWGALPVGRVQHSEVQTWVAGIGKSATTTLRAYGVLAAVLDHAVRDRRIASNPARGVSLPKKGKKARVYLTHGQVELLATKAGKMSTLVYTLAYCGPRWGEATAVRVKNIDRKRRRINIAENAVNVGGVVHVGTPKTGETRSIPYPAFLDDALGVAMDGKTPEQLVFGAGDGHVRPPDGRRGWFVSAVAKCKAVDPTFPTITIHDLRHTAASLAVSAGADVKAVQRMLGHASAAMTLDTYADLFDDDLDAVAVALNEAKRSASVVKMWSEPESENDETP
jgi:integrase